MMKLSDQPVTVNANSSISSTPLEQQIIEIVVEPAECKAYLCGDENIVNSLKKTLFISGVNMNNIYTGPFVSSTSD